jgi:cysteine synthase
LDYTFTEQIFQRVFRKIEDEALVEKTRRRIDKLNDQIRASILDTIGETPLVALDRLTSGLNGRVLAKVEYFNPGFSIKDRIALGIIKQAEQEGRLKPGGTVVELTSGNTGTGAALVCAIKGYRFIAVMSQGNSMERARMMRAFGAEVVLVPQVGGARPGQVSGADLDEVERVTSEIERKEGAFRIDQFNNPTNGRAHETGTGPEIWRQCGGKVDQFTCILGTGGTFSGVSRYLKQQDAHIRCFAIEPEGAAFLAQGEAPKPNHKIQGVGYSRPLPLFDAKLCDGFIAVNDEEAAQTARLLAKREGIFAGFSSGANVAAALRLARAAAPGEVIVTTVNDSGLKYLSTDLFLD